MLYGRRREKKINCLKYQIHISRTLDSFHSEDTGTEGGRRRERMTHCFLSLPQPPSVDASIKGYYCNSKWKNCYTWKRRRSTRRVVLLTMEIVNCMIYEEINLSEGSTSRMGLRASRTRGN